MTSQFTRVADMPKRRRLLSRLSPDAYTCRAVAGLSSHFDLYGQADSGGLRRVVWPAGSRAQVVSESTRLFSCEGRMKDVKTSVRGSVALPMGAASCFV